MKKEEMLSYSMYKDVVKRGVIFNDGQVIVPTEYDYVSRAKKNLFVATKGSVNAYRTYGIEATFYEEGKPYGVYFNECLQNKTLDTEVHFYTGDGQIHMREKIIACIACLNDDMLVLLKANYRWSIALIDYENLTLIEVGAYSNLEYLKTDYSSRRFVVREDDVYSVVSFDAESKLLNKISTGNAEPVEFSDHGMIVKKSSKYGFVKYHGEVILDCLWDKIVLHRDYIETTHKNLTSVHLYNGYCVFYDEITTFESLYANYTLMFKVKNINGFFELYSVNKQLLKEEVDFIDILSDGTAIIGIPNAGYALVKYDVGNDKLIPILPADCFERKENLYDSMSFKHTKVETTVEAVKDNRVAIYDCDGNQLTKFKLHL